MKQVLDAMDYHGRRTPLDIDDAFHAQDVRAVRGDERLQGASKLSPCKGPFVDDAERPDMVVVPPGIPMDMPVVSMSFVSMVLVPVLVGAIGLDVEPAPDIDALGGQVVVAEVQ